MRHASVGMDGMSHCAGNTIDVMNDGHGWRWVEAF